MPEAARDALPRASGAYWSGLWERSALPRPVDPGDRRLANEVVRAFDRWLRRALAPAAGHDAELLELGCAQSAWLPYFHTALGFRVTGLDASRPGCDKAREVLERARVPGEVVHADLFEPPPELLGRFAAVASFGLVEHFGDTARCLAACARYLAPGGLLVTSIPNLAGALGPLQRALDRAVYEIHVPLTATALARAHARAGLEVVDARYLMFANASLLVAERHRGKAWHGTLRRALSASSKLCWGLERLGVPLPPNRVTSPYVVCTARKPTAESGATAR
jgi:cyclopropane fatty-acyl-phospholipid synthase-like methyltransferase